MLDCPVGLDCTSGTNASSSRWLVFLMFRAAEEPCDSYWIRKTIVCQDSSTRLPRQKHHVLIKTHEYTDYKSADALARDILHLLDHAIVSAHEGFAADATWLDAGCGHAHCHLQKDICRRQ